MDARQLLDSLTAHMALYHRRLRRDAAARGRNPNPRKAILGWFSALSAAQRRSFLTAVDPAFVQVLLQMRARTRARGHGFFFLLPDVPSSADRSLPTLCSRRSTGLLARRCESDPQERSIRDGLLLFGSREGVGIGECALDSFTVSEDLVGDVDRFVEVMDGVSDGAFLCGEAEGLGSAWCELEWLKEKGYYTLEAFAANRMEVALRLAWVNAKGGKNKKGGKVKERAACSGIGANAFWRKKSCLDWFLGLDPGTRKKMVVGFAGKGAKHLLVESTFLWKLHDLYSCEALASDNVHLAPSMMKRIITIEPKQYPMHCTAISSEIKLVSEPFKVFDFDFSRRPESQGQVDLHVRVKNSGTIHAVISWWVLQLDSSGSIYYSLSPDSIAIMNKENEGKVKSGYKDWCDHWKQCIWFVPGRGIQVSTDSCISFKAMHDSTSISYHIETADQGTQHQHNDHEVGYSQLVLPPERIGLYGDNKWRSAFLAAMKNALAEKCPQYCLVADDSVFLTMAIVLFSRTRVLSAFPGLREKAHNYLDLVSDVNQFPRDQVQVLGKRVSSLDCTDLHQQKFDMLLAEPFYCGNEGALPWQNLRFWKEKTLLDPLLTEGACIMPCKGVLKACAMSLPDLWRSRCRLTLVEGFDHSDVNEVLGACGHTDGPCLPYFVWQCGETKDLSKVFPVMEFDLLQPIHTCSGKAKVTFSEPGMCHGFALWIDWVLDKKSSIIISTGPDSRYWKQGVKLLSEPIPVSTSASPTGSCCFAEIEASFDALTGDLDVKALFS